jgi:hypothetical protein
MSGYRSRKMESSRELSDFDPISEDGLYNIEDGVKAMVKRFEIDVMRTAEQNGIVYPSPIIAVKSTLCKWQGVCSESLTRVMGDLAVGNGYEVCIDICVENPVKLSWWDVEDAIETMIENSTYFVSLMKMYEVTLDVNVVSNEMKLAEEKYENTYP